MTEGLASSTLWTRRIVTALGIAWGVALLLVIVSRIGFPLELEWMEGGVLHQAVRLQRGEAIYPPPSEAFVPFLYTPLYPTIVAGLGSVFGVGFVLARLVSVCSCVAIGWGIWRAVGRESKPRAHQVAAVAMFCAGYVFTFRWLDLARPDALYMALTVWGLVLLRESWGDHRKAVLAGALIALAFWTKQTAASFVIASGVGALIVAPRQLWSYALTIAVIDGGGVLVGNALTDGWLWHYIYELHQHHAFNDERFQKKTWGMFLHAAPFALLTVLLCAAHFAAPWLARQRTIDTKGDAARRRRLMAARGLAFWALMFAAGLLVSALGYSTQWAEPNAFIPGVVFGAIFVAVALPNGGMREVVGLGLVAAQLVFSAVLEPMYQPIQNDGWKALSKSYAWQSLRRSVPTDDQVEAAQTLREELEASGRVLAIGRPWWSVLAGGPGHIGTMGVNDVTEEDRAEIQAELRKQISGGDYDVIWFEGEPPNWLRTSMKGYRLERRLHRGTRVRPMSGYMSVAGMVTPYRGDQTKWTPIERRDPPQGGTVIADFEDGSLQGFKVTGIAFGRRPIRGKSGRLPAVGPYGGEYLLGSVGRRGQLSARGTATSPVFELPASGGRLEFLAGTGGSRKGLRIELIRADGSETIEIPLPKTNFWLAPVQWQIPPNWAGHPATLQLTDEAPKAALYLDDLWLIPN